MGWALIRGWAPINFFLLFVWHPKILHKHCLQFLLGVKMAPRETENNAYSNFWGDKQRALWYVMVFSGVVNYRQHLSFLKPLYGGQHKQISI